MASYTDEDWEEIGQAWLRAAGQADTARPDAIEFIKWLKRAEYIKDFVCVPDNDLPSSDGKYNPDDSRIYYRQSVWNAAKRGEPRALWTLFHEGSHAIRKHQQERYRNNRPGRARFSVSEGKDEFEADRLTACLVAPFAKSNFRLGTTVDDLRQRFPLSRRAAEKRLEEFERMFRRKNAIRRELPPGVLDFLTRQKAKGHIVRSINDIEDMLPRLERNYDGDLCPHCGEFKLVRTGIFRRCDCCGARLGDD